MITATGAADQCLPTLKIPDLLKVVMPVHRRGLDQLIEPIQQHNRQRPFGSVHEVMPIDPVARPLVNGLFDLLLHHRFGRDVAQLDQNGQKVLLRQLGRKHLHELGLA